MILRALTGRFSLFLKFGGPLDPLDPPLKGRFDSHLIIDFYRSNMRRADMPVDDFEDVLLYIWNITLGRRG